MSWFKRTIKGILTPTKKKKNLPEGLWYKMPNGKFINKEVLKANCYVSPDDGYHCSIGSKEYFQILFDSGKFTELDAEMQSNDILNFTDKKSYKTKISQAIEISKVNDAIRFGHGKLFDIDLVIGCMDFNFIGGSMGVVVGNKIYNGIEYAAKNKLPLVIISKSGGARLMEGSFALMQMAKTSAKLLELSELKLPYISVLTNPTMGGVTASFAMLGDFNIAEPGALIGFAGPRVIKDTIGKELPKGFQTAEFILEQGFLDFISDRRDLKAKIKTLIQLLTVDKKA
jgi:acetyl-CoA carboxylase carboxyl transferase subunit beta